MSTLYEQKLRFETIQVVAYRRSERGESAASAGFGGGAANDSALLRAIGGDAFGECVAVNAENACGARKAIFMACECFLYVQFFKLCNGFVEQNLAVKHFVYQCFEANAHLHLCDSPANFNPSETLIVYQPSVFVYKVRAHILRCETRKQPGTDGQSGRGARFLDACETHRKSRQRQIKQGADCQAAQHAECAAEHPVNPAQTRALQTAAKDASGDESGK